MTTSARHPASCSGASAVGEPAPSGELASRHPLVRDPRFGAPRADSRSNLVSARRERRPSSHAGLGRYASTPPRRSPLRRRSDRHSEPLARFGERNTRSVTEEARGDRWLRSARLPGSLATRYRSGGTARRRCRARGFGPEPSSLRKASLADPALESARSSTTLRPRRVRDTAKGPSPVGPHPRVRSGRRASTGLRVGRVRETAFGRRLGGMWHVLTRYDGVYCPAHDARNTSSKSSMANRCGHTL